MRYILLTGALLLGCSFSYAQTAMECERYQVSGNLKTERSFHRFEVDSRKTAVKYEKVSGVSGYPWISRSPSTVPVTWSSQDGLRVVATLAEKQAEQRLLGPIYVIDLDFSQPRVRVESFGGLMDLSEVVSNPWKIDCRRVN